MRRYAVTERPRAELLTDLLERIRREEHLNPDRPDRAESYRIAHQLLAGDAVEVRHPQARCSNCRSVTRARRPSAAGR
jgi:hypothetical protein